MVSLVAFVALARPGGVSIFHLDRPSAPHVVYGAGLSGDSTCTTMALSAGSWRCIAWMQIHPGERAEPAQPLPPGAPCGVVHVDQRTGRWVCGAST